MSRLHLALLALTAWILPLNVVEAAPTCHGEVATIKGTLNDDSLRGTRGDDVIIGKAGNDLIKGRGGNDTICGGAGDDVIIGGGGDDWLQGGAGIDTASWAPSASGINVDLTNGFAIGGEHDLLIEVENVVGSAFLDNLVGNDGSNTLQGGGGDDSIEGRGGDDVLSGGDGIDAMWGDAGNDVISGDLGDDRMDGGTEADTLHGGDGKDSCKNQEVDTACEVFWAAVPLEESFIDRTPTSGRVDYARSFESLDQVCFWVFLKDDLLEQGEDFWFWLGTDGGGFGKAGSEHPLNLIVSCLQWPGHADVNRFLDGAEDISVSVDSSLGTPADGTASVVVDHMEVEVTLANY